MKVAVRLLFDEGRQLAKWREGGLKIHLGEFLIEEKYDEVFKRSMVFARLMPLPGESRESNIIEPLRNAVIVAMKDDWLRVQGFEYDDFSKKNFYQTWHVELQ